MKIESFFKKWALLFFFLIIFGCNGGASGGGGEKPDGRDVQSPSKPEAVSAAEVSPERIGLSWPAASDNVGVAKYRIYRNGSMIAESGETSYIEDTVLPDPGRYCYSVSAIDEAGNESEKSPETCVDGRMIHDTESPSAPTGLKAFLQNASIRLEWTSASDNVGVLAYNIFRNGRWIDSTRNTYFTDDNIAENASYIYTVTALDMNRNESTPGNEASLKTSSERIKWHFETSASVVGNTGIASDGTIYVADRKRLYAVDQEGREKWNYTTQEGNEYGSLLVTSSGSIYLMTTENLYSLNSSGLLVWKKSLRCGELIAASANGSLYVSDCDSIYALAGNGTTIWQKNMQPMLIYGSGKTDADGNLFIVEPAFLMAIGPDGNEKWKSGNLGNSEMFHRQIEISHDGNIYVASFSPPPPMTNTLYAFSKNGSLNFSSSSSSFRPPFATGPGGILYVCGKSDSLFALNPDGSVIWEKTDAYPSAGLPPSSLCIGKDGDLLLTDPNNGYLRTFKSDGAAGWKFYTGFSKTAPSISPDGTIIVGTENGIYALKPQF